MQPNRNSEWPPRPHFGDLARARRIFEAGNGCTGRAERVPVDLTTMSQIPPKTTWGRDLQTIIKYTAIIFGIALLITALQTPVHAEWVNATDTLNTPQNRSGTWYGTSPLKGGVDGDHTWSCYDPAFRKFQCPGNYYGIRLANYTDDHTINWSVNGEVLEWGAGASPPTPPANLLPHVWRYASASGTTNQFVNISNTAHYGCNGLWAVQCESEPPVVTASFYVNATNAFKVPTDIGFVFNGEGTPSAYEWFASDPTGRYTFYSYDPAPIWENVDHDATYYAYLKINGGTDEGEFDDTQFTVYPVNITPIPTVLPNTTVNITPGPTVTVQTIATFANLSSYNRTDIRIDLTEYFGNITGPYLDWVDSLSQGITDLGVMAFSIPSFPFVKATEIMTILTDMGGQVLTQMSTAANIPLQLARIAANSVPADWQLLIVWALLLESVYLILRGET